jgi:hypothetical protein
MLIIQQIIDSLKQLSLSIPDKRSGKNTQYSMADFILSAFSVFQLQCPSWLEFQRIIEEKTGTSNLHSLFGCNKIPTDNQTRKMLDDVDYTIFNDLYYNLIENYKSNKNFELFTVLKDRHLIAADGTGNYNSKKINCPNCSTKHHNKGKDNSYMEYYHTVLGAVICSPHTTEALALPPTFVSPQESNNSKQDTECKAFKRYLETLIEYTISLKPVFLLDAIYGNQPMIKEIKSYEGTSYIITCKEGSQKNIFSYVEGAYLDPITTIERVKNYKIQKDYRFMTQIQLIDKKNAITVNYIEVIETKIPIKYSNTSEQSDLSRGSKAKLSALKATKFSYITDINPTKDNIIELISCARSRWRVENTFNELKNRGYHFEHNFGHGNNKLSYVLITLMMLAFLGNTLSLLTDDLFIQVRNASSSLARFMIEISVLTKYKLFSSFEYLLKFIYHALYDKEYINTS